MRTNKFCCKLSHNGRKPAITMILTWLPVEYFNFKQSPLWLISKVNIFYYIIVYKLSKQISLTGIS